MQGVNDFIKEEGQLIFDFTGAVSVEKLDEPNQTLPEGMCFVDFVVETDTEKWLIEVKDPSTDIKNKSESDKKAQEKARQAFIKGIAGDELITKKFVPKCRDSYTYLHLMEQDNKKLKYIVLIASEDVDIDVALLLNFRDRLAKRLRQEAQYAWKREYISACLVFNCELWNRNLPFEVRRKEPLYGNS